MYFYRIMTVLVFISLSACSSLSVNYDYDQKVDFNQYKTYDWLPFPEDMATNELNRERFVTAVNKNLSSKGFSKNASSPSFMIAAHFGKESKVDITNWGYSYAPNSYYAGYGYRHPGRHAYAGSYATTGGVSVYEYEQGTLILDFVDANSKKLIWRATAKGIITPASSPEAQTQKINNAVEEILSSFPPAQNNTKPSSSRSAY